MYVLIMVMVNVLFGVSLTVQMMLKGRSNVKPFAEDGRRREKRNANGRLMRNSSSASLRETKSKLLQLQRQARQIHDENLKMGRKVDEEKRLRERLQAKLEEEQLLRGTLQGKIKLMNGQLRESKKACSALEEKLLSLCNNTEALQNFVDDLKTAKETSSTLALAQTKEDSHFSSLESPESPGSTGSPKARGRFLPSGSPEFTDAQRFYGSNSTISSRDSQSSLRLTMSCVSFCSASSMLSEEFFESHNRLSDMRALRPASESCHKD
mmetsp:Transcript_15094/g.27809  ORF Transcript_15094/g.27809 Transcript_15094/m.27809 type:complete len:267 (-) Transcript_15094:240-1040(-)